MFCAPSNSIIVCVFVQWFVSTGKSEWAVVLKFNQVRLSRTKASSLHRYMHIYQLPVAYSAGQLTCKHCILVNKPKLHASTPSPTRSLVVPNSTPEAYLYLPITSQQTHFWDKLQYVVWESQLS